MLNIINLLTEPELKKTAKVPITQKQLDYIIKKYKGNIKKVLNELWKQTGKLITKKMIDNYRIYGTIDFGSAQDIEDVTKKWGDDLLIPLYGLVMLTNGNITTGMISDIIKSPVSFSVTSGPVVDFANGEVLFMVNDLSKSQINSLRETIKWGFDNNIRSDKLKALMKENVSLTARESRATFNAYHKEYNKQLKRGLERGMTQSAANKRSLRVAEKVRIRKYKKLRNVRTERIYRTELSRLKHFSDIESFNQSIATGKIKQATKTWRRTGFNDNWESSILNDGHRVGINNTFPSGDQFPNEINERCVLEYGIKY